MLSATEGFQTSSTNQQSLSPLLRPHTQNSYDVDAAIKYCLRQAASKQLPNYLASFATQFEAEDRGIMAAGAACDSRAACRAGKVAGTCPQSSMNATVGVKHGCPLHAPCMVCFDDDPACFSVQLPCQHATCDACWRGVLGARLDDGDPHRARCSQPGCGMLLPVAAAKKLLGPQVLICVWRRGDLCWISLYLSTHPHPELCTLKPNSQKT